MANLWDDITKTIKEGVDTVVEKTEELTKIGKIKVDILGIKRNVEKNFTELGGKVYHLIVEEKKTQIASDKEVKEIIDRIKVLEKELQDKKEKIERVKAKEEVKEEAKAESKPASEPGAKSTSETKPPTSKSKSVASK